MPNAIAESKTSASSPTTQGTRRSENKLSARAYAGSCGYTSRHAAFQQPPCASGAWSLRLAPSQDSVPVAPGNHLARHSRVLSRRDALRPYRQADRDHQSQYRCSGVFLLFCGDVSDFRRHIRCDDGLAEEWNTSRVGDASSEALTIQTTPSSTSNDHPMARSGNGPS